MNRRWTYSLTRSNDSHKCQVSLFSQKPRTPLVFYRFPFPKVLRYQFRPRLSTSVLTKVDGSTPRVPKSRVKKADERRVVSEFLRYTR